MNPLAMSLGVESIYAVPSEIPDPVMVARLLAPILRVEANDLLGRFQACRSFCWVKRKVAAEEAARVHELNLQGIFGQREAKRFYPKGELAAHVVGYVGMDDRGLAGLEYALDDAIKGRPGRVLVASDARRQSFYSTEWAGRPGKNVVLTLDEKIQYIAAKVLAETVEKWKAAGGAVIVQDPNTGEILALASQPTFNPNEYAQSPPEALVDRGIGWVYEPGSTFKMVTLAAALEEHLTNPQEVINCQEGSITLAGHVIHDHKPFGDLTVTDVLVDSSDVGAIKLGLRLGEERLYRYMHSFGFGSKTQIELPGEERGLLKPPGRWSGISIGEISMGQEIGVTPLQLISAFSAIANGGILFGSRIVQDVFLEKKHDALPPVSGRRVVSEQTAAMMKQMFVQVVERGTGTPARLNGYSAGGKTGTAQKVDASGRYSKSHYVSSFVGFAPVVRPAITILVVIDSPVGAIYGTEVAAPAFRSIAEQTLDYMNVPQDNPSRWPPMLTSAPAGPHVQKRADRAGLLPLESEFAGAATSTFRPASFARTGLPEVSARRAPAATPAEHTLVVNDGPSVSVPDFVGWAARRVAEECQKLGLELNASGSGLVVEQDPPAAQCVPAGTRIWVHLARWGAKD
jgi:cell division protein FtsI (penicillin-binding protein 3)